MEADTLQGLYGLVGLGIASGEGNGGGDDDGPDRVHVGFLVIQ
jgi:hypothetical protein